MTGCSGCRFCRIHHCITISMLAEKLAMDEEEAERWIVNLIRNAALDARIDSAQVPPPLFLPSLGRWMTSGDVVRATW